MQSSSTSKQFSAPLDSEQRPTSSQVGSIAHGSFATQRVPIAANSVPHSPLVGSHTPIVQPPFVTAHATSSGGSQIPDTHTSPLVHAVPSLHGFESSFVCTHPWVSSHASSVQSLPSSQLSTHSPAQQLWSAPHKNGRAQRPSAVHVAVVHGSG